MSDNHQFRILIVDDDEEILNLTKYLLANENYHVGTALSGKACMESIKADKPDLLLLDVVLPDISGIDLCRTIKSDPVLYSIHILLVSGFYTRSHDIADGLDTGADGYLTKPFNNRELIARVGAASRLIGAEKAMKESEQKFRHLFENSATGMSMTSLTGEISVNMKFCEMIGFVPGELNKANWKNITYPDDLAQTQEIVDKLLTGKTDSHRWEKRYIRKNGTLLWADVSTRLERGADGTPLYFITSITDISAAKESAIRLRRLNRTYALLSAINQTIVRVHEIDKLFEAACRIAVDQGGFMMAWIGLVNQPTADVTITASDGATKPYLDDFHINLNDSKLNQGPTARSILTSSHFFSNDIGNDPQMLPWRDKAIKAGFLSSAAFPLVIGGQTLGAINLYSAERNFFDEEELNLLDELAANISFAMEFIDEEDQHIKAEDALKKSEAMFRAVVENSNDGIIFTDADTRVIYRSPSYNRINGYTNEEWVGQLAAEQVHPDDLAGLGPFWDKILSNPDISYRAEYRIRHKDGSWRWIESMGQNLLYNPDVQAIIITSHNITHRRQVAETLRISEEKFRLSFMNNVDATYIAIMETGKVIEVNDVFEEIFGYTREETIGNTAIKLGLYVNPADRTRMLAKLRKNGRVREMEVVGRNKNGDLMNASISVSLMTIDNETHLFGIIRDITERKRAERLIREKNKKIGRQNLAYQQINEELKRINEELLRAKERAEESDRLKSAFLANMSHEIRTPMNGILGFSELLKEPGLTGEEQSKYIDMIERGGVRMLNIINDIVDIAKIESGQMHVHFTEIDINTQVEYLKTFFKPEVESKKLRTELITTTSEKSLIISTDREKINSILTNLVKNAIKFTDEGSIEFGYQKQGDWIRFFVKDTGIGIPRDKQAAIFERFIQAEPLFKHTLQGTGLGLSISKAYVEMLGGKIWLESEPGSGSTFYFTIPCRSSFSSADLAVSNQ